MKTACKQRATPNFIEAYARVARELADIMRSSNTFTRRVRTRRRKVFASQLREKNEEPKSMRPRKTRKVNKPPVDEKSNQKADPEVLNLCCGYYRKGANNRNADPEVLRRMKRLASRITEEPFRKALRETRRFIEEPRAASQRESMSEMEPLVDESPSDKELLKNILQSTKTVDSLAVVRNALIALNARGKLEEFKKLCPWRYRLLELRFGLDEGGKPRGYREIVEIVAENKIVLSTGTIVSLRREGLKLIHFFVANEISDFIGAQCSLLESKENFSKKDCDEAMKGLLIKLRECAGEEETLAALYRAREPKSLTYSLWSYKSKMRKTGNGNKEASRAVNNGEPVSDGELETSETEENIPPEIAAAERIQREETPKIIHAFLEKHCPQYTGDDLYAAKRAIARALLDYREDEQMLKRVIGIVLRAPGAATLMSRLNALSFTEKPVKGSAKKFSRQTLWTKDEVNFLRESVGLEDLEVIVLAEGGDESVRGRVEERLERLEEAAFGQENAAYYLELLRERFGVDGKPESYAQIAAKYVDKGFKRSDLRSARELYYDIAKNVDNGGCEAGYRPWLEIPLLDEEELQRQGLQIVGMPQNNRASMKAESL